LNLLKRDLRKLYRFTPIYSTGADGEKYVSGTKAAGVIYGNVQPERLAETSNEGGVIIERLLKVYTESMGIRELDYLTFNDITYKVLTVEDWLGVYGYRKLTLKRVDGGV
jgi:hypothetical protein